VVPLYVGKAIDDLGQNKFDQVLNYTLWFIVVIAFSAFF
jgi:ABC-type multidrug transport system fused ATPase/permease subunit